MPQIRVMGDDPEHVDRVVAALRELIAASPELVMGDVTRLRHRGGGGRIVFDVCSTLCSTTTAQPVRVERVERVSNEPAPRPRPGRRPRALPPGKSS